MESIHPCCSAGNHDSKELHVGGHGMYGIAQFQEEEQGVEEVTVVEEFFTTTQHQHLANGPESFPPLCLP